MWLTRLALRNPVLILMMSLAALALGWVSLTRLAVDLFPNIDIPQIRVATFYPGARPVDVEKSITVPIERAVSAAPGVDRVESTSKQGFSSVTVWFQFGTNLDNAQFEVQQRVAQILNTLPPGIQQPFILQVRRDQHPGALRLDERRGPGREAALRPRLQRGRAAAGAHPGGGQRPHRTPVRATPAQYGEAMLKLATERGCMACHSILPAPKRADGLPPIAPAWRDIAIKYRDDPGASQRLTRTVMTGSNPKARHSGGQGQRRDDAIQRHRGHRARGACARQLAARPGALTMELYSRLDRWRAVLAVAAALLVAAPAAAQAVASPHAVDIPRWFSNSLLDFKDEIPEAARDAQIFVPDLRTFPKEMPHQAPYLISESEVARALAATAKLRSTQSNPLHPQTMRLAFLLTFCCGLRKGEVLKLRLADIDTEQMVLRINETKFYKSRLVPLSPSVADELRRYFAARRRQNLPMEPEAPLVWNGWPRRNGRASALTSMPFWATWQRVCRWAHVFDHRGRPPRLHDLRHGFAVAALRRGYDAGLNAQAVLPRLARYMGHAGAQFTHYYLKFTEPLRCAASDRFRQHLATAILSPADRQEGGVP